MPERGSDPDRLRRLRELLGDQKDLGSNSKQAAAAGEMREILEEIERAKAANDQSILAGLQDRLRKATARWTEATKKK